MAILVPHFVSIHVIITAKLLKQSQSPILFTDKLCSFNTEATSSGLWENVELYKNKISTNQDGTTRIVLGQGCLGVLQA